MIEAIYNHSPVLVQNVMCSVKGWLIDRKRFSKGFLRELRRMEARQDNSEEMLRNFLALARHVPAYAKVFADGRGTKLEDFPIINKAYLKEHYEEFCNPAYKGPTLVIHTSGTTGTSVNIPQSQNFEHRQWATWWRYREELGIKYGTWYGWFGCADMVVPIRQRKPPYWRIDFAGHRVMFGTYHLNIENVECYVEEIERRKLTWLHGHASRLCYLSRLIVEKGLSPLRGVRFVTTGSENLLPQNVKEISRAFPCALIRTHYGMTEGVANFSQTKDGSWRIDDDFAHVEFIPLDANRPERCRIIGTNFSNAAFPLIRYEMGDIAIVKWEVGKPIVLGIEGRENESIVMDNGMLVNAMLSYDIFGESSHVLEAQIRVLNGCTIELLVVKSEKYVDEDERRILQSARRYLKDEIRLSIRYTSEIPRAKSGKFRAVVKVDESFQGRDRQGAGNGL